MGHKIHPTGLRLGITQEHRSRWYASSKNYPSLLQEDDRIRKFIHKKYGTAGISDVLIARKADQLEVELKTARPGVLVGRQGSGIEELRSGIQKTVGDNSRQVRINVVEVERVDADAFLLAEYIAHTDTSSCLNFFSGNAARSCVICRLLLQQCWALVRRRVCLT